jgi:hypothetical protein
LGVKFRELSFGEGGELMSAPVVVVVVVSLVAPEGSVARDLTCLLI